MRIEKTDFFNNPNIGLFGFATDKFCVLGNFPSDKYAKMLENTLKVPVIKARMMGTTLAGIFSAGNSHGIVVSSYLHENEIAELKKHLHVLVLDTEFTALGNMILCNDHGCVISHELNRFAGKLEEFLKVPVSVGLIIGIDLVGSLAVCNNEGCLIHKLATAEERDHVGKVLKVPVSPATVNFGNHWVRSGMITNTKGILIGDPTSGPELGIITETLGFV
jgi:translation initiation factor 6